MSCQTTCEQGALKPCGLCLTTLEGLGVRKGNHEILRDVSFEVHCGELTALIGPNGAGKSTLLKAILGEIAFTGKLEFTSSLGRLPKVPRIGYVPQRLELDAGSPTSVSDLMLAAGSWTPVWLTKTRQARARALDVLSRVRAEHLLDRRLGALSGGELQRVLLAIALDPLPQLLLLDEPVSGVDIKGMELFYDMVASLRLQYDMSILLVSHDLDIVAQHADKVVFLDKTVVSMGTAQDVFSDERVVNIFGEGVCRHVSMVSPG